ncbi:MAG: CAP domain-containing protein [Nitrososphaerota archaeon]|nr:CAP domain-containing protein [Nitrososphaerota archaeon]MDG6949098.1 CAP domain-containing protein [Nitrososphaerota archaeon]
MKFVARHARSISTGGPTPPAPDSRGGRAKGLVVVVLVLVAALAVVDPSLSATLRHDYSTLVALVSGGKSVSSISVGTSIGSCSSAVTIQPLTNPDIVNGSAVVAYPPDYCTLAGYALAQINADRAANGTGPVALAFNRAAQQHADSMLYYSYFSHFDTQGYKPYMRYTLLGGRGADFENIAYSEYSVGLLGRTAAIENAIRNLEHLMVYNDVVCCNNGHRYNILDPLHNFVSVGVAYNSTYVFFDEEFQNEYLNLSLKVTSAPSASPYQVTMLGTPILGTPVPTAIYVAFDTTPAPETRTQLESGPTEYGPGALLGGVLPPTGLFGGCGQFATGITQCASRWAFNPTAIYIAFSLNQFVKEKGPGVYTIYLVTGPSTDTAITTISIFVP